MHIFEQIKLFASSALYSMVISDAVENVYNFKLGQMTPK